MKWKDYMPQQGYEISDSGAFRNKKTGRVLTAHRTNSGYLTIRLHARNHSVKVHRAVATHFIDNPLNKPEVNHRNGAKADNRVENLEWCTREENISHAQTIGLKPTAKPKDNKKLRKKIIQLDLSGRIVNKWSSTMDIRRSLGYDTSSISKAIKGVRQKTAYGYRWSRIIDGYNNTSSFKDKSKAKMKPIDQLKG